MNSSKLTLVACVALVSLSPFASAADAFVRPVVSLIIPQSGGLDNEVGYGVAAGALFGADSSHEWSLEVTHARWKYEQMMDLSGLDGDTLHFSGPSVDTVTPVLVNYRYRFGSRASRVRFYLGHSLGATQIKRKAWAAENGMYRVSFRSENDWKFTVAGSAGVAVKLTERVELEAGYRYSWVDDLISRRTHNVYLGAGIKF